MWALCLNGGIILTSRLYIAHKKSAYKRASFLLFAPAINKVGSVSEWERKRKREGISLCVCVCYHAYDTFVFWCFLVLHHWWPIVAEHNMSKWSWNFMHARLKVFQLLSWMVAFRGTKLSHVPIKLVELFVIQSMIHSWALFLGLHMKKE